MVKREDSTNGNNGTYGKERVENFPFVPLFPFVPVSLFLFALALTSVFFPAAHAGAAWQGGGFTVFGRVSLPDGRPATRVKVKLDGARGLTQETLSDDQGNYEFRGMTAGRYRMSATNPNDPEQYSDRAESDTTRAYSNRLQIDIYLRLPLHSNREKPNPGTLNVAEATQNIPKPARQAYEKGLKFQKENQADKALASFNQALELYPDYFQALTDRANLFMQYNKLTESLADFDRALQINPKYSPALRGAGYCNIQLRKYEEAIVQLEKSITYEPKVPLTHMLLGYANLSLNRYEVAKQSLQQALKLGADNAPRARVYLAEVLAHEGKFKEAADEIRTYLRLKPNAADAESLHKLENDWRARSKAVKDKQ
jgi:tetratricopeptide (TPR) repeat protein